MPSQDKLIKQGLKYTDSLFDEISKRLEQGVKASDTLEAFLDKYNKAFPDKGNPLITLNYDKQMLDLILSETNNHKFSRPAQKELVRVTIENQVGELIDHVGEDIKDSVRDIVKEGYDNNLSQDEIAENISNRVSAIKGTRAKAIARTEIARTATISDYVINAERGATHFYVECRNTACPICKENWLKNPDKEASGKGLIGDRTYSMSDTAMLPPVHPNCRCVPYFINPEDDGTGVSKKKPEPQPSGPAALPEPTPEQLRKNLNAGEREKYNNYKRNIPKQVQWLRDNPNAPSDEIAKHQKRLAFLQKKLDELTRKALGGKVTGTPKPKPKPEPKPEPKAKPKPKETPKPKEPEELPNPTSKQLKKNLTPQELKNYKRWQKEIKSGKLSPEFTERRKKDVENLKRKALGLEPLETKKQAPSLKVNRKQLEDGLNYGELKEYDDLTKRIDKINKWLNNDPLNKGFLPSDVDHQKRLLEKNLNRLNELKKKALSAKPKVKPKLEAPFDTSKHLTKEQVDKMDFKELAEHHGAEYLGIVHNDYDGKNYHVIKQTFEDGREFVLRFEDKAVKSYAKKNVATANEIIHEVFKVPEALRIETKEIWFKDTQQGIRIAANKSGLDTIGKNVGGYNASRGVPDQDGDSHHRIVINPKYFKLHGKDGYLWVKHPDDARAWKMTIYHEFTHSGDTPKGRRNSHSNGKDGEYRKIEDAEKGFTWYGNSKYRSRDYSESYAEHGGYIAYMESNPSEQNKKIEIQHYEDGKIVRKKINYEEYKELYPKHYAYFMKKFKEGF